MTKAERLEFERYLLSLGKTQAMLYLMSCLVFGTPKADAWRVIAYYEGDNWHREAQEMIALMHRVYDQIAAEHGLGKPKGEAT